MKNIFTGSYGNLRFRIEPNVVKMEGNGKEVNFDKSTLLAQYWHGQLCYEKSDTEGQMEFPMSPEGREQLKAWLESKI